MPEGPEVQTIVNDLNKKILRRKITGVWTDWPKMVKTGFKPLEKEIKGAKVQKVRRRGKNILIYLKIADERGMNAEKHRKNQHKSASSQRQSAILLIHQ